MSKKEDSPIHSLSRQKTQVPSKSLQQKQHSSPMATSSSRNAPSSSRKRADLHLQGLPPFHPAVYQASTSGPTSSPSRTRTSEPRSYLSPRARQHETQQQLRTMQRELIASISRNSPMSSAGSSVQDTPKAPSLAPALSPGPPTPLNLQDSPNDYLSAGSAGGLSPGKLEEIIRKVRDGKSPGLGSNSGSPAVSPAGGR